MIVGLTYIASVHMGYSFRSGLKASKTGDVSVIQMKDLLSDNTVSCEDLMEIEMKGFQDRHLVRKGDLIFRSRGLVTTSAILVEDPGRAIVSAPLFRIRIIEPGEILPEYLNWYISQKHAQIFLNSRAIGTAQKMISMETLTELEIVLPSLQKQRAIIELALLSSREQALYRRLAQKREQYISMALMQSAQGV